MNLRKRFERVAYENSLVKKYVPTFKLYQRDGLFFFSGWIETKLGRYKLRLVLDPEHPFAAPRLFLASPKVLYTADGRSVNSLGCSYRFHTESNGPGGSIRIAYTDEWDASNTCVAALIKGIVWIEGYEKHRLTGRDYA